MKAKKVLQVLTGFLIVFSQIYSADSSRRYPTRLTKFPPPITPATLRERAQELLDKVDTHKKKKFRTDRTRGQSEKELYACLEKILHDMESMPERPGSKGAIKGLREDLQRRSLEGMDLDNLVIFTKEIFDALAPTREFTTFLEKGDIAHVRSELARILLGLQEFMDITEDSDVDHARFQKFSELAHQALPLIEMISDDAPLVSKEASELAELHKAIQKKLTQKRMISPQAAAKVTVFVVQGLLQVAGILAIQVNKLALAERPDLVAQRSSYRKWGICTVVTAMALSAVLIAGNAAGIIDIQIIPSVTEVFAALPNILSV